MADDWAWPALIESLQRDIAHLRELADESRRDVAATREQHRRELDALIEQLREVRTQLTPLVQARANHDRLSQETRWRWIERLGWVAMGAVALGLWELIKRQMRGDP